MAKAVRTAAVPARVPPRVPARPPLTPRSAGRQGMREYLRGVWDELKKVVWPARDELARMTGIVIATVVLFGVLIGAADYVLSLGVKQLYTTSGSTTTTTAPPATPTRAPFPGVIPTSHAAPVPSSATTAPVAP